MKHLEAAVPGLNVIGRPFTGAWIETPLLQNRPPAARVAPSRGRGLKLHPWTRRQAFGCRPFTGAWIETRVWPASTLSAWSPLHGGVD